jgi:hypothetical protein
MSAYFFLGKLPAAFKMPQSKVDFEENTGI